MLRGVVWRSYSQSRYSLPLPPDKSGSGSTPQDVEWRLTKTREEAKRQSKLVLVVFQADWCHWCAELSRILKRRNVRSFVRRQFVVLTVDVGRFDRNMSLTDSLGFNLRKTGIPFLLALSADGSVASFQTSPPLEDKKSYSTARLLDWLLMASQRPRPTVAVDSTR